MEFGDLFGTGFDLSRIVRTSTSQFANALEPASKLMTSLQRPDDEIANAVTHGFGFLLSLAATGFLIHQVRTQSDARIIACGLYSASLIMVFGASTLSHLCYDLRWRQRFRTLDQASIFLLIAGTYTPFAVVYLYQGWWCVVLIIMWIVASLGIARVAYVRDLPRRDKLLFGAMGIIPSATLGELSRLAPTPVLIGILLGGASYLVGTIFLRLSGSVPFTHAVWHMLVVLGSGFHYWSILAAISDHHSE